MLALLEGDFNHREVRIPIPGSPFTRLFKKHGVRFKATLVCECRFRRGRMPYWSCQLKRSERLTPFISLGTDLENAVTVHTLQRYPVWVVDRAFVRSAEGWICLRVLSAPQLQLGSNWRRHHRAAPETLRDRNRPARWRRRPLRLPPALSCRPPARRLCSYSPPLQFVGGVWHAEK